MRVHPSQLRTPIERLRALTLLSTVFLVAATGVYSRGFRITATSKHVSSSDGSAALLTAAGRSIVLLSGIRMTSEGLPSLSIIDKAFLKEAEKFGAITFVASGSVRELPAILNRNLLEVKSLLESPLSAGASVGERYSRIFVPGNSELYLIEESGAVLVVDKLGESSPIESLQNQGS